MEKNNKILVVLVIILSILVLLLGGYVIYDKILNNDSSNNNFDNDNNVEENNIEILNEEALNIVKDLAKKYFIYKYSLGPYCGETNSQDYISFGSYETQDFRDYVSSVTYKNIDEIRNYYKSIMVEELMPSYLNNDVSYIEQDRKLYCQLSHKGCGDTYKEEDSYFTIHSKDNNRIVFNAILVSGTCGSVVNTREGTIEITKNTNGNYVISKYDVQISDLD